MPSNQRKTLCVDCGERTRRGGARALRVARLEQSGELRLVRLDAALGVEQLALELTLLLRREESGSAMCTAGLSRRLHLMSQKFGSLEIKEPNY